MNDNSSIHFEKLIQKYQCIEGLAINKTDVLKKCQTWNLLMVNASIVAMFVKLCIYSRNLQSVLFLSVILHYKLFYDTFHPVSEELLNQIAFEIGHMLG